MHKKLASKPLGVMERTVPKSKKYGNVQGKLNTGLTVDKVRVISAQEYARRRDEVFYRLNRNQLIELFGEYEADHESIAETGGGRSDFCPRVVTYTESAREIYDRPYLILDAREADQYNACHILQARSYPITLMRRDYTHPELYNFKNKPEALIVIYCDDERISREAAAILVGRGVDNAFLLSGGLAEFAHYNPAFIEGSASPPPLKTSGKIGLGSIPEEGKYSPKATEGRAYSAYSGSRRGSAASFSGGGLTSAALRARSATSGGGREDMRSEAGNSRASNMSVAESVISKAMSRKGRF